MRRTRFAPSPTGSLHVGNALSAVANRGRSATGCCCGSTTPTRRATSPAGRRSCCATSSGSGSRGTRGRCARASGASATSRPAAPLGERFDGVTLVREDGSPTYHLASVVDDIDFGITHVVRGNDHRPNEALHRRLFEALGATPPEFVHHGLILGEDGKKLSKRAEGATVALAARGRDPGRGRARATSRSSACRGTTSTTTCRGSGGWRSRRSGRSPTRSWPPASARRSSSRRRCAARAT